jgi:predicted AAA+ superfamily ATPase
MERNLLYYLTAWIGSTDRKPLIIRGARQVGKTWLVRKLAEISGKKLIELNFEKQPAYSSIFSSNNVEHILLNLSTTINQPINPENCLLFLDEIQAIPELLSKLRWFAEDLPQLPVIAAGSLLEFTLAEHSFSMPVGRISYMHLEPLSFEEFLLANNKNSLYDYIANYNLLMEVPAIIHDQFIALFKEYLLIGGLPGIVSQWIKDHSLQKVNRLQNDLLTTYRDDFAKYRGRIALERLDEVMMAIPGMVGQKFVFSRVNKSIQTTTIKQVLDLLEKARVSHRVKSSAANGVPLGAEIKEKYFKEIFLDVGLCSTALGLNLNQINSASEIIFINNGNIAEQIVGQLLRTIFPPYMEPNLYCWHREEPGSSAEIDYVIQHNHLVIPIEVKAGSTGSLKSLHLFMQLKKSSIAMRINSDYPSKTAINIKDSKGNPFQYTLLSIPFYLIGQIHRLLDLN